MVSDSLGSAAAPSNVYPVVLLCCWPGGLWGPQGPQTETLGLDGPQTSVHPGFLMRCVSLGHQGVPKKLRAYPISFFVWGALDRMRGARTCSSLAFQRILVVCRAKPLGLEACPKNSYPVGLLVLGTSDGINFLKV